MNSWLFFLAVFIIAVVGVWLQSRSEQRRASRHMRGRPALTDDQFGSQFFPPDRADIAARLRRILSRHISVDLSRLHPDDKLVEDIRMDSLDSLSTVEFVMDVEKEFGISIADSSAEQMRTLREVIDYVATHLPQATV